MWPTLIILGYLVGAFFFCRFVILTLRSSNERDYDKHCYSSTWSEEDTVITGFAAVFWPIVAIVWFL